MTDQQNPTLPPEPPWPQETGIWGSYALHCHCGAIRYNMKLSPPIFESEAEGKGVYPVMSCNCSYCERVGYLTVHPLVENVEFTQGLEHRAEYLTSGQTAPLWFCKKCGSALGADIRGLMEKMGAPLRYGLNVRMLKDSDVKKLTIKEVTFMKDMPPKYDIGPPESEKSQA
ncbi:hypothetical protein CB0940_03452 [Cercospora beticola]|uniref:CENP-V/GFA domain-containing protein n=1 Tax=Cercospora beticola TaxID=122368 RepID=A0A2G5I4S6_CERBT|nr:hypothetical protein CB0940_03452 [Cercospora beticola]PIA99805.1 hypothetical protein CB0940_03452 [Cercospora beticola]WPB00627.1 hypothetical protein RHO25_005247 [Cercospora beticola]CAK1361148.1 unnamed protein product [Cercospora beticola]